MDDNSVLHVDWNAVVARVRVNAIALRQTADRMRVIVELAQGLQTVVAGTSAVTRRRDLLPSPGFVTSREGAVLRLIDQRSEYLRTTLPSQALTPREVAILRLMEQGLGNEEIGKALGYGHGTIKLHVRGILEKFATSSRAAAVARAIRSGSI